MADLFAPPTLEELQKSKEVAMMAPPTQEELSATEQSTTESLARTGIKAIKALGPVVSAAGSAIDYVGGAPTRSAISAIQEGKNPASAFFGQYLKKPSEAPTGKQILAKAGVSTEEGTPTPFKNWDYTTFKASPAGIGGLALDVVADPTNFLPVGAIAKGVGSVGMKGTALGIKGAAIAADVATGTKVATNAFKKGSQGYNAVKEAAKRSFKVADDFEELARVAADAGIKPDELPPAVEFGHDSSITKEWKRATENPVGGEANRVKFKEVQDKIRAAVDAGIAKINGGPDVLSKLDAGDLIREGYNKEVRRQMLIQDDSYKAVANRLPNVMIEGPAAEKLEKTLKNIEDRAFEFRRVHQGSVELTSKAEHILGVIDAIRKSPNIQEARLILRPIGEEAFGAASKGIINKDVAALRELYNAYRTAITDAVGQVDKDAATALKAHNQRIAELFERRKLLERHIANPDKDGAQVFDAIMQGNTERIDALKGIMAPDDFNKLKATFLDSLRRDTASGDWTFGRLHQQMQVKEKLVKHLFNDAEFKGFNDFVTLGNRMGNPVLSTSGTGASIAGLQNWKDKLLSWTANKAFVDTATEKARQRAVQEGIQLPGTTVEEYLRLPTNATSGKTKGGLKLPDSVRPRQKAAQAVSTTETNDKNKK